MPSIPTPASDKRKTEAWVWVALVLAGLSALQLVYLGQHPGGRGPILVYGKGLLLTGILSGLTLVVGLVACLRRPPALQRGRLLGLVTAAGSFFVSTLPFPYPSSHAGHPFATPLSLPFEGEGSVVFGGDGGAPSPLALNPGRRFGWQFELPQGEGGAWVVAPCEGKPLLGSADAGREGLVLELAPERFLVLEPVPDDWQPPELPAGGAAAGLFQRGQRLWRASGSLILYMQDTPLPGEGEGVPVRFADYWQEGVGDVELADPVPGRRIRPRSR